ncbi:MAG TPA: (2Fe-2S) ferredoxin domain-containing protein [Kofleriaceae bacterium]|jgi:(2Fe-2S) ferredoxin|nr:(2Fe-2S) ferredoxin domain-containing protein [Kofleriaceae bacterium]
MDPSVAARRYRIIICRGPECGDRRGSALLHEVFRSALEAHQVRDRAELVWQSCFGRCTQGPNVLVREMTAAAAPAPALGTGFATPPGPRGATALYNHTDPERVERIVTEHVVGGRIVRELVEKPGDSTAVRYSVPLASTTKDPEQ